MRLTLRATLQEFCADTDPSKKWKSPWLEVLGPNSVLGGMPYERCEPAYWLMCEAIVSDIQSAEGSGQDILDNLQIIESGKSDMSAPSGNAWIHYITRDKVWFEGLYSQGEGGEVSFAQYKLAVETYVRFLADPQRRPITVEFPE